MTLIEFLDPLRRQGRRQEQILAVLYFFKHFEGREAASVAEIRQGLLGARIPQAKRINVTQALTESAPYTHRVGPRGIWALTGSGERQVQDVLALPSEDPQAQHDVRSLEKLAGRVGDDDVRGYIEEAIKCLQVDALRAAVVFLWTGAARALQDQALAKGTAALNAAITKHDPKARVVSKIDDFAYIKDKTLLLACGELGVLDKGERGTLEDALNLRNRSGHPTKYKPGSAKVASFIEDVVGIVW